ncbi:MAG: hypothetical protein JW795_08920 [Chitinivibrionales bacterium]|nr:hypothetical protein [Chitinivibrionales bacterium]
MILSSFSLRIIAGCTLFILAIIAVLKGLDPLIERGPMRYINQDNTRYLDAAYEKSIKGSLILSVIKSTVAIIEGSEVGIGFSLEIGDIVQALYDYIDIAWKTALAASAILLMTKVIYSVIGMIDHYCLSLFLFALCAFFLVSASHRIGMKIAPLLQTLASFLAVAVATLYIVIPLTLYGTARLSALLTQPLISEATEGFHALGNEFSAESISEKILPQDSVQGQSFLSRLNVTHHYDGIKKKIKELGLSIKEKLDAVAIWTVRLIAGYLLDCIIFPLTIFFILLPLTKGAFKYCLDAGRNSGLKTEISALIDGYAKRL